MALDTAQKRYAMAHASGARNAIAPLSVGATDKIQRGHFAKLYAANLTPPVDLGPAFPDTFNETVEENGTLNASIGIVDDPDGLAPIPFEVTTDVSSGTLLTFNTVNGDYTYQPDLDYVGPDLFIVTVTDLKGFTSPVTVNIDVTEVVDTGPAFPDTFNEETTQNKTLSASIGIVDDPDGLAPIPFTVTTDPANGQLLAFDDVTGDYQYHPNMDYLGLDQFIVTVLDQKGFTSLVTINILVVEATDGVTLFDLEANKTGVLKIGFETQGTILDTGSQFSLTFESYKTNSIGMPTISFNEEVPFPISLWDWWQYLNLKLDKDPAFQNIVFAKVQQGPMDFRWDARCRVEAELIVLTDIVWKPTYTKVKPDTDAVFSLIQGIIALPHPELVVTPELTVPRVTSEADTRVLANGATRVIVTEAGGSIVNVNN